MIRLRELLDRLPPPFRWLTRRGLRLGQSRARLGSNAWLRRQVARVEGHVLSIGSGSDQDCEDHRYRDSFTRSERYTTSEAA